MLNPFAPPLAAFLLFWQTLHSPGGISSVGRALDLHSRGQEFDSPILHHFSSKTNPDPIFFWIRVFLYPSHQAAKQRMVSLASRY